MSSDPATPRADLGGLVGALAAFSAATVHEVAGEASALPLQIKPVAPGFKLCGPAFTVSNPPRDNLWIHRAVYLAPPGSVIVASFGGEHEAGYWGEILSTAAQARGLAGVVLDGCARDAEELEQVGFPVFARGLCVRGTGKDPARVGGVGGPLTIGRAQVRAGDVVLGDRDGVVVVARAAVAQVVADARARVVREAGVIEALRAGQRTLELFGLPEAGAAQAHAPGEGTR